MKKILPFALVLILASCGFESKSEFREDMGDATSEEEYDFPETKFVSDSQSKNEVDFEEVYGKGRMASEVKLTDSLGFLKAYNFAGRDIGLSVLESSYSSEAYSAVLSYENEDNLIEKEYGPLVTNDNIYSQVNFDLIDAESGPSLIVSQLVIDGSESKSAYYIYNKYMSLIDSFHFENSIDNVNVDVYRMSELIDTGDDIKPGDIEMAVSKRIDKEEEYLKEIFRVYKLNTENIKTEINDRKILVGLMPSESKERLMEIKLIDRGQTDPILSIK